MNLKNIKITKRDVVDLVETIKGKVAVRLDEIANMANEVTEDADDWCVLFTEEIIVDSIEETLNHLTRNLNSCSHTKNQEDDGNMKGNLNV